jgi:hypothetical protein
MREIKLGKKGIRRYVSICSGSKSAHDTFERTLTTETFFVRDLSAFLVNLEACEFTKKKEFAGVFQEASPLGLG